MSQFSPALALAFLTGLMFTAFLNMGTVRKQVDPILKTQTAPIKLKDKLEEIKDGEKGPATPVFTWYGGGNKFMVAPPFDMTKVQPLPAELVNKVSEVDVEEKKMADSQVKEPNWGPGINDKEPESLAPKADKGEDVAASRKQESPENKKQDSASKPEKDWWDAI